jgi:hypothetical protein
MDPHTPKKKKSTVSSTVTWLQMWGEMRERGGELENEKGRI